MALRNMGKAAVSLSRWPHLAQRLFNTPLAIRPEKAEIIIAALAERLGVTHIARVGAAPMALAPAALAEEERAEQRPYEVVQGIAIVPVCGTLVQKCGWLDAYSGMTGYDSIRAGFLQALDDDEVDAIVLDVDSPGGEVAGCFDLVDTIYAARGTKPIHAVLTESAYSAAYALASAADQIWVPRTGGVGSIGVIAMLVDLSQALTKEGITVNLLTFGARKADGNQYQPLPKEARERFQQQVDTMGELFVETVARNRKMSAAAVRGTEAATFLAAEGVALGLADTVAAPDAAFAQILASLKH